MDIRELEETIKRLDQSINAIQRTIEDISKKISELEDQSVKVNERLSDELQRQSKAADANPGLQFVASEVERKFDREKQEIEDKTKENQKLLDEEEKKFNDAKRVLDELLKVEKNVRNYKLDADNWISEANKFIV